MISPRSISSPIVRISAFTARLRARPGPRRARARRTRRPPRRPSSRPPSRKRRSAQPTGPGFQISNTRNATNPDTSGTRPRRIAARTPAGDGEQRREREPLAHHLVDHDAPVVFASRRSPQPAPPPRPPRRRPRRWRRRGGRRPPPAAGAKVTRKRPSANAAPAVPGAAGARPTPATVATRKASRSGPSKGGRGVAAIARAHGRDRRKG